MIKKLYKYNKKYIFINFSEVLTSYNKSLEEQYNEYKKRNNKNFIKDISNNIKINLILKQYIINEQDNKKIIIIDNKIHTKDLIELILKKEKIKYDYIYCNYQNNISLIKATIKDLKIQKKDIIYISSKKSSNFFLTTFFNIKTINGKYITEKHSKKITKIRCNNSKELYNILSNYNSESLYDEIGYKMFGPLLLGFCQWIKQKTDENNFDDLIFLSRDGQIVSKAYEVLYNTKCKYVLASRRTLTIPLLADTKNFEDILKTVPYIKREENIKDFLYKLGIEDNQLIKNLEKEYGQTVKRATLIANGDKIFEQIKEAMHKNSIIEREAAIEYLNQNINGKNVGLVDIGWCGTMQKSMKKISHLLKNKINFCGLYLGLIKKENNVLDDKAYGFIFDFNRKQTFNPILIQGYNGLIELLFTANHGSAKKYIIENGKPKCILEDNKGEYSDFVKQTQAGAIKFIKDYIKNKCTFILNDKEAYCILNDLLLKPTNNECKLLGELKFYDIYFEKIIQFKSIKAIIKNPKENISNFLKSNWKIGYIREAIPFLNAGKVYLFLNKIKKIMK